LSGDVFSQPGPDFLSSKFLSSTLNGEKWDLQKCRFQKPRDLL